jgi:DNA-binding winged helix-turn-helix (wHTH) protein
MASSRVNIADRVRRRWSFANCMFDEGNWTLTVDGRRVPIEAKPLELLRELLLRAGNLVTKDELLDRAWPDVTVVEASLPTAVRKLRLALGDDRRDQAIIETVPGIGYRLTPPVEAEELFPASDEPVTAIVRERAKTADLAAAVATTSGRRSAKAIPRWAATVGTLAIASAVVAITVATSDHAATTRAVRPPTQRDAANALRKLDVGTIDRMLAAGWNPNTPFDKEGNGAINYVLNICEWDRGHDQEQMVLMVRTLIDGGAKLDHRNVWGDTAYSIAKAVRYCGPNHPVTQSIRAMCYAGYKPLGDRCLASYEIDRRRDG